MCSAYESEWIVVEMSCLSSGYVNVVGAGGDDGDAAETVSEMTMDAAD